MNGRKRKTLGVTLIEMTLVLATIVLLIGFGIPAVRALRNSFHSEGGVTSLINAALSSARAMAVQRQSYVGLRFQTTCADATANADEVLASPQYAVFIIHDPEAAPDGTQYANGFRAVEGIEPIKLPEPFVVMDLTTIERTVASNGRVDIVESPMDATLDGDAPLLAERLRETTAFSIVFSPSGKLIVHEVRVWNRHGRRPGDSSQSPDDVFNTPAQRINPDVRAMFCQDEVLEGTGLGPEFSRTSFVVCDRAKLRDAYKRTPSVPWAGYLQELSTKRYYVSPYTGELLSSSQR